MNNLPTGWEPISLEHCGEIVSGGTPDRNNPAYWNGDILWVTPSEITANSGKYLQDTREKITKTGLSASSAKLLPVNTLLVTSRATLGEIALAAKPVSTNQGFKSIVPNSKIDPDFAYHKIKTIKQEMVRLASGTTFLEISKGDFSRIVIQKPQLPEQSRIAYVLDTIDEAIAQTEAVIAKLKQVRAGMLHDLLSYGLDKDGQLRDPIAHPEQFKDSPLGLIPKEWEMEQIGSLFELGRGRVISQLDLQQYTGIYPVYSSQSANDGVFGYLNTFDFDGEYITWTTDGANAGTVFYRNGKFNCTNVCGTLKSKGKVQETFGALTFARESKKHVSYVGNPKLMNNTVSQIWIVYPANLDEQQRIVRSLNKFDVVIDSEQIELTKLKSLKSGLQDDLLTGRVRVPETILGGGGRE